MMIFPIFACFIFSARVGNSAHLQVRYEVPVFLMLTTDLATLPLDVERVYSIGEVKYARNVKNIIQHTPFNALMSRGTWYTIGRLHPYGNEKVKILWAAEHQEMLNKYKQEKQHLKPVVNASPFYKIYHEDDTAWIVWEK